jgi:hypothetical protein
VEGLEGQVLVLVNSGMQRLMSMTTSAIICRTGIIRTRELSPMVYCEKCEVVVDAEEHAKLGHPLLKLLY